MDDLRPTIEDGCFLGRRTKAGHQEKPNIHHVSPAGRPTQTAEQPAAANH